MEERQQELAAEAERRAPELQESRKLAAQKDAALLKREAELSTMREARAAAEKALEDLSAGGSEKDAVLASRAKELAALAAAKVELEGGLVDMKRAAEEKDAVLEQRGKKLAEISTAKEDLENCLNVRSDCTLVFYVNDGSSSYSCLCLLFDFVLCDLLLAR